MEREESQDERRHEEPEGFPCYNNEVQLILASMGFATQALVFFKSRSKTSDHKIPHH